MKQFSCGDVVPGCQAVFTGASEDEVLGQVATHAAADHGMEAVPDEVVADVRSKMVDVG
jgi:predicted small metal-binding protein